MRSEMVFAAERTLPNRYMLCRVLATATRKFHKPATRIEDTTDALLRRIAKATLQHCGNGPLTYVHCLCIEKEPL